ncbi:hypothetical protein [Kitasatospora sp. NPDC004289]
MGLCHWKFDGLSIGWGTIDTSAAIERGLADPEYVRHAAGR